MTARGGAFVAVVGPSGAGKDTLIGLARRELQSDGRFLFVRRLVTRSADPRIEDHDVLSADAFSRRLEAGGFSLNWQAHGLSYALPASVDEAVREGRLAVANVSRSVLGVAAERFARLRVVNVSASPQARLARIVARGREDMPAAASRVAREVRLPADLDVVTIDNDGRPEEAAARLVAVLAEMI
ncbi:phosphonate metabolism protein/1,5-bisphosphokinase (PRPP-forming) PhnN [Lutibaculum baratangense]|uniref:Ribose 1,5-bisphosphate phosphokinase PhnN n=1 Tax=Lutibaculum baratangense AMV1 TaxID=631454 RepID=V4RKQ9_9HYPH|nr:phosphonate metabolism protein/1,5-bisphosphokinase (PRPP-forming) PhnN [Lutibaculum baratangense]ESR23845.1 ATP-binding protein PhnN [Lutibaculum baratangense AMV1]